MRTWTNLVAVFGLSVAGVACGDDGTTSDTAAPATSTPATQTTSSAAQLEVKLLVPDDVGGQWQLGHDMNEADYSAFTQLPCENTALNPTIIERLTAQTGVQFDSTDFSLRTMMELLVVGEPDRLGTDLGFLAEAYDACAATVATTTGVSAPTVDALALPELGDQRYGYVMSAFESESAATWHVRLAMVRVGSIVVSLGLTEILPTPDTALQISDEQFVQLVETAVAKLNT
ncbi:MAG: hypothetical protein WCC60_13500 [Ilumatobacteraceae bacterium]